MIDMKFFELEEPSGDYVRIGGRPYALHYRINLGTEAGESAGWWIPVPCGLPRAGEKFDPASTLKLRRDPLDDLPPEERAAAGEFFDTLEGRAPAAAGCSRGLTPK